MKKNIETCKEFVQLVADLGGRGVKVRPNGIPKGAALDKTLEQIGKALIPCGKAAEDAGLEIWVEVHGNTTAHPPNMKTIMQHCNHPKVGLTWNSNKDDIVAGSVRSISRCFSRGFAPATSTNCTRMRPACIPTGNCSACSANRAMTA